MKSRPGKSSEVLTIDPAGIATNLDLLATTVRRWDKTRRWMVWFIVNAFSRESAFTFSRCTTSRCRDLAILLVFFGFEFPARSARIAARRGQARKRYHRSFSSVARSASLIFSLFGFCFGACHCDGRKGPRRAPGLPNVALASEVGLNGPVFLRGTLRTGIYFPYVPRCI